MIQYIYIYENIFDYNDHNMNIYDNMYIYICKMQLFVM